MLVSISESEMTSNWIEMNVFIRSGVMVFFSLQLQVFCRKRCCSSSAGPLWFSSPQMQVIIKNKRWIRFCRLGRINFISYMALLMRFSRVNPPKVRLKALLNKHFWQMLNRKVKMSDLLQVLGCGVAQFKWNMYLPEGISSTPGVWEDWVVDGHRGRRK